MAAEPGSSRLGRGLSSMVGEVAGIKAGARRVSSGYMRIPLADIDTGPRSRLPDERLRASIKRIGILQPLLVTESEGGRYLLLAGSRRLQAARDAGLADVPVIVVPPDRAGALDVYIEENLGQNPLREPERHALRQRWMRENGRDEQQAAAHIPPAEGSGRSASFFASPGLFWKAAGLIAAVLCILLIAMRILNDQPEIVSDGMETEIAAALETVQPPAPDISWMESFAFPGTGRTVDETILVLTPDAPSFDPQNRLTRRAGLFLYRLAAITLATGRELQIEVAGSPAGDDRNAYQNSLARAAGAAALLASEGIPPASIRIAAPPADAPADALHIRIAPPAR